MFKRIGWQIFIPFAYVISIIQNDSGNLGSSNFYSEIYLKPISQMPERIRLSDNFYTVYDLSLGMIEKFQLSAKTLWLLNTYHSTDRGNLDFSIISLQ